MKRIQFLIMDKKILSFLPGPLQYQRSVYNRRRVAFSTTHHTFERLPKAAGNDVL